MSKEIITLSEEEVRTLTDLKSPLLFKNDFDLIYESQVPNVGILFLEGELKILRKRKILSTPPLGSLIGLYHLMHNTPLPMGVKVCKNTSVIMIEKSTILEALAQKSGTLYQIISNL